MKKNAIVIGSGAGGAMAAKELQKNFNVTVLEAGKEFIPFNANLKRLEKLKPTKIFFDARLIQLPLPSIKIHKISKNFIIAKGIGIGGTTTLSAANIMRCDEDLQKLKINLDAEFEEILREMPIVYDYRGNWNQTTKKIFSVCDDMGLSPVIPPKIIDYKKCRLCGQCVLGCRFHVKWDSREVLNEAVKNGAKVVTNCRVDKLNICDNQVKQVCVTEKGRKKQYEADVVVLAAGGLGTPVILQNSMIECKPSLFVDPLICVAAPYANAKQDTQIPMPFIIQKDRYMISPYLDYLSFFFSKDWKEKSGNIISLMIKIADKNTGKVTKKGIDKTLLEEDKEILKESIELCEKILVNMGIKKDDIFLGIVNAGHPGGMLPLTEDEAETLHNSALPENLYVADASLLPNSMGKPPILTIMALAKKISNICAERFK